MKRILIAEDERSYSFALDLKLGKLGYNITIVENGQDAIDRLLSETFDLLLLDISMPKRSGYEVLQKLRGHGSSMPVLVLSNLDQTEEVARAKQLGATEFMSKSNVLVGDVVAAAQRILGA